MTRNTISLDTILDNIAQVYQLDDGLHAVVAERDGDAPDLLIAERTDRGILFRQPTADELTAAVSRTAVADRFVGAAMRRTGEAK